MSELRIRSESGLEPLWPDNFVPRPAGTSSVAETAPFLLAVAAAFEAEFGQPVNVLPASDYEAEDIVQPGGARLAALLLTRRLGGRIDQAGASDALSGAVWLRFQRELIRIATEAGTWPTNVERLALMVSVGEIEDGLWLEAPDEAVRALPRPGEMNPRIVARMADTPMRLRVELSSAEVSLAALVPLTVGQVLILQPSAEMRLRMETGTIGAVTLTPLDDGRQQAMLINLNVETTGDQS